VARKFDNGLLKQILEGSLAGSSSAGRASNRWENRMWMLIAQLLNTKIWCAVARCRGDYRKKTGETMARIWAKDL